MSNQLINTEMEKLQAQINVKQGEILAHKSYLNATDYKVARAFETKTEIDPETLTKREEAREAINLLESEIAELKEQIEQENENNSQQALPTELLS
jgi:phage portal protein BeeE